MITASPSRNLTGIFAGKEAETEKSPDADSEGFVLLLIPGFNLAVNPCSDSQAPDSLIIRLPP